jgi:hypothetical protein
MESKVERRTLNELQTLYQLEPGLRDIYVEGPSDCALLRWILRDRDLQRTQIYDIDTIEITAEHLEEFSFLPGARSRIIVLGRKLEAVLPMQSTQVTCVIDSDIEGALGRPEKGRLILGTDYADIEGYLLTEEVISKFLLVVLGVQPKIQVSRLLEMYLGILREPFLLRMAGSSTGIPLARVKIVKSCQANGEAVRLDRDDLVKRMLEKSGAAAFRDQIEAAVQELRGTLNGDPRCYVSGHEFIDLFGWHWATQARKRGLRDLSAIGPVLRNGLDSGAVSGEPLFQAIRGRLFR